MDRRALPLARPLRRSLPHRRQPHRPRPHPAPRWCAEAALRRLWPLRCATARASRTVEVPALRAAHRGPQPFRPRLVRQQRPALRPLESGRGLPQDRHRAAVRSHLPHRGRGGNRLRKPRPLSASAESRPPLRGLRHLRQRPTQQAPPRAHLRAAWHPRGGNPPRRPEPRPALRPVRRRSGQPGDGPRTAPRQTPRQTRPHHRPRLLRRCRPALEIRACDARKTSRQRSHLPQARRRARTVRREGIYQHRTPHLPPDLRDQRTDQRLPR